MLYTDPPSIAMNTNYILSFILYNMDYIYILRAKKQHAKRYEEIPRALKSIYVVYRSPQYGLHKVYYKIVCEYYVELYH